MAIRVYVDRADWDRGRGHRMRTSALVSALGCKVEVVHEGPWDVRLNEGGHAVLRSGAVLDDLEFALLRPEFARNRPPVPRDDPPGVAMVCYPSTLALEMICLGYRVALLPPRNKGERALAQKILDCPDPFKVVDGLGAYRVARFVCGYLGLSSTGAPRPGSGDATPPAAPHGPPG